MRRAVWLGLVLLWGLAGCSTAGQSTDLPREAEVRRVLTADPRSSSTDRVDLLGGCGTVSFSMTRAFTAEELASFDRQAGDRGGRGWLIDGDAWAAGQGWLGTFTEAIAGYGGTAARVDLAGHWLATERDGKVVGVSLLPVELSSGTTLWFPHNFIVPGCR